MIAYFFTIIFVKKTQMKKVLSAILLFSCMHSNAQYAKTISLKKGQTIVCSSKTNTESEMGMGNMKNDINTASELTVIDENEKSYILTSTLSKMKMDMEGMGQNMSYDSDNKEDRESEMGKMIGEKLNSSDTFSLDKSTGSIKLLNVPSEGETSGSGGMSIMSGGDKDNQVVGDAFLIIPSDKKIGDSWNVTTTNKGLTTNKTYTLKTIDNNIALVELTGTTAGTVEQEVQGMTMNMTMDSKFKGEIKVNTQNGIVTESKNNADLNNSMDMMGQQMQISSKANTVSTFTSKS